MLIDVQLKDSEGRSEDKNREIKETWNKWQSELKENRAPFQYLMKKSCWDQDLFARGPWEPIRKHSTYTFFTN